MNVSGSILSFRLRIGRIEVLDFIFKGGAAVMLLLGKAERFSIDIDIDIIYKDPIDLHVLADIAERKERIH